MKYLCYLYGVHGTEQRFSYKKLKDRTDLLEMKQELGSPAIRSNADIYVINNKEWYVQERYTNFDTKEVFYVLRESPNGLH